MSKRNILILIIFAHLQTNSYSLSHTETTVEDIINKNIKAVGSIDKLSMINAYEFKAGPRSYYMASTGVMKMTAGNDPVITEIILTTPDIVTRNCYNRVGDLKPLLASTYQALAKLRCGFFTLMKFSNQLEYQGEKISGSKKYILLTSKEGVLDVEIFIDVEDYLIRRFGMKGYGPAEGSYEINHEINAYQEVEGIKLPTGWFSTQPGRRSVFHEISNIRINPELKPDFFSSLELNAGEVEITYGHLKGNVMTVELIREMSLMISTNWTKDHTQSAGFTNNENLLLEINGEKIALIFFESLPPRTAYSPGSVIMIPSRSDENYVIYLLSSQYKHLNEILNPLYPIQISKID